VQIVGISLVRNEDRFVRQALCNVSDFCDRIVVADHRSSDRTPAILSELAGEFDHLEPRRISHSAESHALIEDYAGSDTWVLSVDGDELYDREGLRRLRDDLERGVYADVFRLRPAGIHCDELDEAKRVASGYLSPPSRPLVGLLNFAAIESWSGVRSERLHGGDIRFRRGYDLESWRHLGMEPGWELSPFRALHVCFLRRSSSDSEPVTPNGRPNLAETGAFRRDLLGPFERLGRRALGRGSTGRNMPSEWKAEKYRRGEHVSIDAAPFLGSVRSGNGC
jgi:glycosyltransferase involved in cell wall biosynthesis